MRVSAFSYSQICMRVFCTRKASKSGPAPVRDAGGRRSGARARAASSDELGLDAAAAHILQEPEDQVLRRSTHTARVSRAQSSARCAAWPARPGAWLGTGGRVARTIGCVMIFWTLLMAADCAREVPGASGCSKRATSPRGTPLAPPRRHAARRGAARRARGKWDEMRIQLPYLEARAKREPPHTHTHYKRNTGGIFSASS